MIYRHQMFASGQIDTSLNIAPRHIDVCECAKEGERQRPLPYEAREVRIALRNTYKCTYLVCSWMFVAAVSVLEHPTHKTQHSAHSKQNGKRRHDSAAVNLQPHSGRHHRRQSRSQCMTHTERVRRRRAFI